jgi:HlyD family secretion protein
VEQARWSLLLARRALSECEIRSPVSGVVTARLAEAGELAAPGTGIALLSDLSSLSLRIFLPEAEIGRVSLGEQAAVSVDSFPGRTFPGTVSFISPRAEFTPKNVQTKDERVKLVYAVRIDLGDGEGLLKPGMPADANLDE